MTIAAGRPIEGGIGPTLTTEKTFETFEPVTATTSRTTIIDRVMVKT